MNSIRFAAAVRGCAKLNGTWIGTAWPSKPLWLLGMGKQITVEETEFGDAGPKGCGMIGMKSPVCAEMSRGGRARAERAEDWTVRMSGQLGVVVGERRDRGGRRRPRGWNVDRFTIISFSITM